MPVLRSPYLSNTIELRRVAAGGAAITAGARSPGVAQVQAALRDLGYGLTRSTGQGNVMDGFYGDETVEMVSAFQLQRALPQTGVMEARTLAAIDTAMAVKLPVSPKQGSRGGRMSAPPTTAKPAGRNAKPMGAADARPLPFWDDHYEIGTADPFLQPDAGAGGWKSKPLTYSATAQAAAIQQAVILGIVAPFGRNATRHLRHYFWGNGRDLTIDLEDMVQSVPSARTRLVVEFRQAQEFLRDLPPGRYDFTSRNAQGGYNLKAENKDWFFATGGYSSWGKGRAEIRGDGANRRFDVDFTYKFFDRYNWDGDKETEIAGFTVTDEFMGEFHRQGLAKEFNCYGSINRRMSWTGVRDAPPASMIILSGGR